MERTKAWRSSVPGRSWSSGRRGPRIPLRARTPLRFPTIAKSARGGGARRRVERRSIPRIIRAIPTFVTTIPHKNGESHDARMRNRSNGDRAKTTHHKTVVAAIAAGYFKLSGTAEARLRPCQRRFIGAAAAHSHPGPPHLAPRLRPCARASVRRSSAPHVSNATMTKIHAECVCGKAYDVPEEKAGKRFKCPACGEMVQVPDPAAAPEAEPEAEAAPAEAEAEAAVESEEAAEPEPAPAPPPPAPTRAAARPPPAPALARASPRAPAAATRRRNPPPSQDSAHRRRHRVRRRPRRRARLHAHPRRRRQAARQQYAHRLESQQNGRGRSQEKRGAEARGAEGSRRREAQGADGEARRGTEGAEHGRGVSALVPFCAAEPKLEGKPTKSTRRSSRRSPRTRSRARVSDTKIRRRRHRARGRWLTASVFAEVAAADATKRPRRRSARMIPSSRPPTRSPAGCRPRSSGPTPRGSRSPRRPRESQGKRQARCRQTQENRRRGSQVQVLLRLQGVPRPYLLAIQDIGVPKPESTAASIGEVMSALHRAFYRRYANYAKLRDLSGTPVPVWVFASKGRTSASAAAPATAGPRPATCAPSTRAPRRTTRRASSICGFEAPRRSTISRRIPSRTSATSRGTREPTN
mgnify:CR=1 FL=1